MRLDALRYKRARGAIQAGIVFDPDEHPRDLEGQFREVLGAKIKLTNSLNVGDVPVGGWIRTVNNKTFEVSKHGKWTTVYPIDADGKRTGKHTVLPKDTQVERVLKLVTQKGQNKTPPQTPPGTIPRHIDAVTKTDGTKILTFTFPDGTKDVTTRDPAYSNSYSNIVRTAIAYRDSDGKYGVYWTRMFTDSDGVKSKVQEFVDLEMEDITVLPMLKATHQYMKREKHDWPKDSVKAVLGDTLLVDEPDAPDMERTLADIEYLPRRIAADLVAQGVKMHVGARTVPDLDDAAHLRKVQPRGYPSGKTWNDSGGCYSPVDRFVMSGSLAHSGSTSTILHEIGHAVGHTLNVDTDSDLKGHHRRLFPKLGSYYQQDGPGGRAGIQELWAESFAEYLRLGRPVIVQRYDEAYADWMQNRVEQMRSDTKMTETRIAQMGAHGYTLKIDAPVWREIVKSTAKLKIETPEAWLAALAKEHQKRLGKSFDANQIRTLTIMTKNILDMYHGRP